MQKKCEEELALCVKRVDCVSAAQVDITAGLQKQVTLLWCKECGRYLQPPKHWVAAAPESKELLTFCIKRLKGLQKVSIYCHCVGSADMLAFALRLARCM